MLLRKQNVKPRKMAKSIKEQLQISIAILDKLKEVFSIKKSIKQANPPTSNEKVNQA